MNALGFFLSFWEGVGCHMRTGKQGGGVSSEQTAILPGVRERPSSLLEVQWSWIEICGCSDILELLLSYRPGGDGVTPSQF